MPPTALQTPPAMVRFVGGVCDVFASCFRFFAATAKRVMLLCRARETLSVSFLKAIDIMEQEPERQENLWKLTEYALEGFRNMGCEIGTDVRVPAP